MGKTTNTYRTYFYEKKNLQKKMMIKMVALALVASGAQASNDCASCLKTGTFSNCYMSCQRYSPMYMESIISAPEKRGLRALCLKNPRAAPCMNLLRSHQNNNLFF